MELWHYIEVLSNKKQSWLFHEENIDERLIALEKISELGTGSIIHNLIPFLKDNNKKIRDATCDIIVQLFNRIETKKGYYNALKHCDISERDIDYYEINFEDHFFTLVVIASLNGSGYVREKAVKKLIESASEKALPFIVYRLADWVPAVRKIALRGIETFKKKQFINALVSNLSIFEWLQKVERVNLNGIYSDIMHFVVQENKNYVQNNFKTFSDKTRFLIAKRFSAVHAITREDLQLLLGDVHFLIRNLALMFFDTLSRKDIQKLLEDKSARIRIQTLYKLKSKDEFLQIIYPFLFDVSASIREFARYSLKKEIPDFATIYNNNLQVDKYTIGSLSGLAETNGKEYIINIESFLNNKKINIRKTAFLTLKKLDPGKAYYFAFENLDCEYTGIRNLVIEYIASSATPEALQKAREVFSSGNFELKKAMLKLFAKIGRWTGIADIMIGTINENEDLRQLSFDYLQQWRNKATRYFTTPKPGELERANQIFKLVFEMHEKNKYFKQNPVSGIDFYLG